jgi:hypothetical protein
MLGLILIQVPPRKIEALPNYARTSLTGSGAFVVARKKFFRGRSRGPRRAPIFPNRHARPARS